MSSTMKVIVKGREFNILDEYTKTSEMLSSSKSKNNDYVIIDTISIESFRNYIQFCELYYELDEKHQNAINTSNEQNVIAFMTSSRYDRSQRIKEFINGLPIADLLDLASTADHIHSIPLMMITAYTISEIIRKPTTDIHQLLA